MPSNTPSCPDAAGAGDRSVPDAASIANITATLRADYTALQNDLEQAQELAADFQRQLAGKSNEVAHIKVLLEKTQIDLARMEGHIAELRAERHRLANEAMEVSDLRSTVESLSAERDHSRREAEALRTALTTSGSEYLERIRLQELEIARLRAALEQTRERLLPGGRPAGDATTGVQDRIAELSATVERLESIIRQRPASVSSKDLKGCSKEAGSEFIDISFHS